MCCQIVDWKYTAPSSGHFQRCTAPPQACGLSLRLLEKQSPSQHSNLFMYFPIKKKDNKMIFFHDLCFQLFSSNSNSRFLKWETHLTCLSVIFSCSQNYRGLVTKTKTKDREKLSVEKWPQILNRMNRLGLGICQKFQTISCFWYSFAIFFEPLRGPFQTIFEESETTISNSFVSNFIFVLDSSLTNA